MKPVIDVLREYDGLATTAQLRARGIDKGQIDIALMYDRIWRVRKGLWCLPDIPRPVLNSQRAKGRLACVSALEYHGVFDHDGTGLHVSARLGQVSWHPVPQRDDVVRHWSRSRLGGDRFAVDVDTAWAQFALCRGVAGRDVRLRRTDSL